MRFNPSTDFDSIVKKIDDLADSNVKKYPLAQKARAVNSALDKAYTLLFQSADTKNYDDHNFSTIPQGTYDIVAGQRNLVMFKDQDGAEILKIHRVIAKNSDGNWYELERKDIRDKDSKEIAYGTNTGQISAYDWVGNTIVFDVTPESDISNGIKVFYMRNSSYFEATDIDKEPGLPALFHDYLVYYAAWTYCMRNGLERKNDIKGEVQVMEQNLINFASSQSNEENKRLRVHTVNAQ